MLIAALVPYFIKYYELFTLLSNKLNNTSASAINKILYEKKNVTVCGLFFDKDQFKAQKRRLQSSHLQVQNMDLLQLSEEHPRKFPGWGFGSAYVKPAVLSLISPLCTGGTDPRQWFIGTTSNEDGLNNSPSSRARVGAV